MNHVNLRFGFAIIVLLMLSLVVAPVAGDEMAGGFFQDQVQSLASSYLSIAYQADVSGGQVTQVDAYITKDEGRSWERFASQRPAGGLDTAAPGASPGTLGFEAESDGLYGFFIVLHNTAGASSPPPEPGTAPQQWIRVDRESPLVQILEVCPDERFDLNRDLTIRWAVQDADLPDRPISLHYRSEQTKSYRLISESLAATSSYRWTVPEDLRAPIEIKATAIDRAGNIGRSVTSDIAFNTTPRPPRISAQNTTIEPEPAIKDSSLPPAQSRPAAERIADPFPDTTATIAHGEPDAGTKVDDPTVNNEAQQKYESGTWHRLRGEADLALARYREALVLDPQLLSARHDMACLLLVTGHPEEAEEELRKVLAAEPAHRGALKSLALVQTRQQNYRSAGESLQRLLLLAPDDAEAWLYFGDIAMFMGDRAGAREAWAKVEGLEGVSDDVRRRAAERMKLYPGRSSPTGLASGEPEP